MRSINNVVGWKWSLAMIHVLIDARSKRASNRRRDKSEKQKEKKEKKKNEEKKKEEKRKTFYYRHRFRHAMNFLTV